MAEIARLRNVAFVGPHHAGKTTLVEAVLSHCGAITRRGSIADGTTVTDHEPECVAHLQSTTLGFAHCADNDIDITIVDTPGFVDFFEETKTALRGVDAAVIVVDAEPSRISQTYGLLEAIEALHLPHLFVINKMDRPGADFEATLHALQATYGRHVVAEQWPIGTAESFTGYIDLVEMIGHDFANSDAVQMTDALLQRAEQARGEMLEAMADFDDQLLETLLEGAVPSPGEVERDLCVECAHDQIVPVLAAAGAGGLGVPALVRALERWFPSPVDAPHLDAQGREIVPDAKAPLAALVIKTIVHPQSGKLSVVRVLRGTLDADAMLTNARDGERVRTGGLYRLQGKKQEPLAHALPGSIVAIARLEHVITGDTLTGNGTAITLPGVEPSTPVFAVAIEPKDRIDEAKISHVLAKLLDEDPALRLEREPVTHELLLLGSGEQHVGIALERLNRKYKVEVRSHAPRIPFQETIGGSGEFHARYKHQTGGHGQFADVRIRFEPRPRGSGVSFTSAVVGGAVPRQFIPAVEKGILEALARGPGGHPVTDLHATLLDGQYHDVDSSEQAFKNAAGMAVRDAMAACQPLLLEPIARVSVSMPSTFTSAVIGQLTAKRGQILGINSSERAGFDTVEADVPQVELSRYITELRTATGGLGTYAWRHERYDPVQGNRVGATAAV